MSSPIDEEETYNTVVGSAVWVSSHVIEMIFCPTENLIIEIRQIFDN
jgi:hypothetical protein